MGRKKIIIKPKEEIKLRYKKLKDGQISLYLDKYVNGVRSYEFLRLYINPQDTAEEQQNTLKIAEQIRKNRIEELKLPNIMQTSYVSKVTLFGYIDKVIKISNDKEKMKIRSLKNNIEKITNDIPLSSVDDVFFEKFNLFLKEKGLKSNTVNMYSSILMSILKKAQANNILPNILKITKYKVKKEKTHIDFLTIEELNKLIQTPYKENIKRPFIFSCLTGLRYSDVFNIRWSNIQEINGNFCIQYKQVKTKKEEMLPINRQAFEIIGKGEGEKDINSFVFEKVILTTMDRNLKKWAEKAGVNKHLHFHVGRHTFATLSLNSGAGIMTVQKLLGHSTPTQTMVYAELLDKTKIEAVNKLPQFNKLDDL